MTDYPKRSRSYRRPGPWLWGISALVLASSLEPAASFAQQARPVAYDVQPRRIGLIAPGTVIGNKPPRGWTNIVIKSFPKVGAGDIKKVAANDVKMAGILSTAFLANIKGDRGADGQVRYRLSQAAVGLGATIGGRDVIVSPETQSKLGADFGFLARLVLSGMYKAQKTGVIVARSNTMGLVDTPCLLRYQGVNRNMTLRYALLVSPKSGRLDTLMWLIDLDNQGAYRGVASSVQWLAANKVAKVPLYVDAEEYTLGIPSDRAFAAVRIPQGQKQITIGRDVAAVLGKQKLTLADAKNAETWLWGMLRKAAEEKK